MKKEKYPYILNETTARFDFESTGPNGTIKKTVDYYKIGTWIDGSKVYNLAFGDWDENNNVIDDLSRTDNNDRDKILATVASTVIDMVAVMEDIAIYAEGSTPARTRLYQIAINANREEIEEVLNIYGYIDENWQRFESGKNYEAFLVTRKKV
ncbi:hypothetical protein [[Flexibacter] sp. ATCC 35208]|uniref:DUF6934 family protein n=1 Tax=[Flexibacter] sp. ATCC 35208 TaxID=1936242 RepID=UPI0009D205B8|nr:hypothetical protein [[Flexibacter] sp. ATCC 35208]OMP75506.1 hypothetical protein BW716_29800 [[Flexibacter] sp. ATCC 35208]